MKNTKKCLKIGLVTVSSALGAASVHASAFDLPDQDAFAIGRGMAVVATADNPSAIYYNPAGITQIPGANLRLGMYAIDIDASTHNNLSGISSDNENKWHAIPQFYFTYTKPDAMWTFGLGSYSPFGLGLEWPQDAGFRTVGYESALTTMALNPVIALKLSPTLSIGGGPMLDYANADLRLGVLGENPGTDILRYQGDGYAVAYNLGVRWQPIQQLSFGATFRSGTTVDLHGHTVTGLGGPTTQTSSGTSLPLPLKAIFGVSYRPTDKWNFEFDADYTDWSVERTLVVSPTALGPVGLPLNWQPSWYFEFGGTRYLDKGWYVSAGYIYNENSVPNANYTPLVADMDKQFGSIGIGHKGKKVDFDLAYQFGYGTSVVFSPGNPANGNYTWISHAIAVSCTYHF